MNDELREAALLIGSKPSIANKYDNAGCLLAKAYLVANKADENEPADAAWLKSVGGCEVKQMHSPNEVCFGKVGNGSYFQVSVVVGEEHILLAFGNRVKDNPTRGDVRLLARALGVKLEES